MTIVDTSRSFESVSTDIVDACRFGDGLLKPALDSYCFANLPGFFERTLLGSSSRGQLPQQLISAIGAYDHVVFLFLDAFGWESFQRFRGDSTFLRHVDQNGLVVKTTSQFPSTTAVHVTTEATGQPLCEHQVCGWDYYEPRVGRMIKPLKFSYSEDKEPGTLVAAGLTPHQVLPPSDMLSKWMDRGVLIRKHGPAAYFPSPYNTYFSPPGSLKGYSSFPQAIALVREVLGRATAKSYQSVYIDSYDTICHEHGVGSQAADKVAKEILGACEAFTKWRDVPRTLLVVSADHGQIADKQGCTLPINELLPGLPQLLKKDSRGEPIRFSGGRRYLFLHPEPHSQEYLLAELRSKLKGAATVLSSSEASDISLLGVKPLSSSFIERLGSILILPHAGYSVFWNEPPAFEAGALSSHGGASPAEMETPLLLVPLG